jgi:multiple antibiotic resistance protein
MKREETRSMTSLAQDAITLFVVIDPVGTVPLFLSLTRHLDPLARRHVATRCVMASGIVLLMFLVLGHALLGALGIGIPAFRLAGGIVVFLFGLQMIFETEQKNKTAHGESGHDLAIFPLAFPAVAGPAAMLTVILVSEPGHSTLAGRVVIGFVLAGILGVVWLMFLLAEPIQRLLGRAGANLISRVLGMLLAALAAQTALDGLTQFFQAPKEVPVMTVETPPPR